VHILTRGRENTCDILKAYGFKYQIYGTQRNSVPLRAIQTILNDANLLRIAKDIVPDGFLSFASPYFSQVAKVMGKPSIAFADTESARLSLRLTYPFTTAIYTPETFALRLGSRHFRFKGFKELAYLDPKYFNPSESSLSNEFKEGSYGIIRINSFDAVHDIGLPKPLSLDDWNQIFKAMSERIHPIVLSELELPHEMNCSMPRIDPTQFHAMLSKAAIVISDSCTITTESAILGVPTIFAHPAPSLLSNFEILEKQYKLIFSIRRPGEIISKMNQILDSHTFRMELDRRRRLLFSQSDDVTMIIVKSVERWCK